MEELMFLPTTRGHAIWAGIVALAIVAGFASVWPIVNQPLPQIAPFMPMFSTAICATESMTAMLLCMQFAIFRRPFLGALSGAYAFVAVIAIIQLLVFPGVFSPTGLFDAGPQSAIWIWVFWHGGFAFFVLFASTIKRYFDHRVMDASYTASFGLLMLGIPLSAAGLLSYLAIGDAGTLLPPLIAHNSYRLLLENPSALAVVLINVITLTTVLGTGRGRTVLDVWLCIALLAAICDIVLTLYAGARYTAGWYTSRCLALVSSASLLSMLLWELIHLYRNLNTAHAKLTEYSIRDGLTGSYNRRFFDEHYDLEILRAARSGRPLSVLMADVDWFKAFNDTFGHQAGDRCLVAVAQALDREARHAGGFAARYGGEEFAIVLPNTDRDTATAISEQIRGAIAALRIPAPPGTQSTQSTLPGIARDSGVVTLSVGAATQERPSDDSRKLLSTADQALYMAKHSGRNRVCFASLVQNSI